MAQDSFRSAAGAEFFRAFSDGAGYTVVPEFRAAWLHQFLDTSSTAHESFAATPSAAFSTTGINVGRDAALLEGGFAFKAPDINLTFYAQYAATLSSREVDHTVRGGFAFFW
jgi:outer membrane autotransporter protein